MLGPVRFFGTVVLAAAALAALLPFHMLNVRLNRHSSMAVARLWQRFACWLMGVRITVTGAPATQRPLLLLANHISWLDIPVLASVAPVSFIAKQEVAGWPMVGFLSRTQRTVFVDRERRHATAVKVEEVASRLSNGDMIVLFAEGTSGDGNKVLPFRSSLVGAAQRTLSTSGFAAVQPVAIAYRRVQGLPLGRLHRPLVAWYGGAELLPHLRRVMSEGGVDVHVVFGPLRQLAPGDDRKAVAGAAGELVRRVVAALNAGRLPGEALGIESCAPITAKPFPIEVQGVAPIGDNRRSP